MCMAQQMLVGVLLLLLCLVTLQTNAAYQFNTVYSVAANVTDPAINDTRLNFAYIAGAKPNLLFVFLPGTGAPPAAYKYVINKAASIGYGAIGLTYVNGVTASSSCSTASCFLNYFRESITGQDLSPNINVNPSNSIINRLVKWLQWLNTNNPAEGWDAFYDTNNQPKWNKIVFGGHSQGALATQVISVDYSLVRALQMAGGILETQTHATPINRTYTFYHQDDAIVSYMPSVNNMLNLSQFGSLILVNSISSFSQFGGSHMLMTNVSEPNGLAAHNAVAVDTFVPFTATDPTTPLWHDFVWGYMLGEDVLLPQSNTTVPAGTTNPASSTPSFTTTTPSSSTTPSGSTTPGTTMTTPTSTTAKPTRSCSTTITASLFFLLLTALSLLVV